MPKEENELRLVKALPACEVLFGPSGKLCPSILLTTLERWCCLCFTEDDTATPRSREASLRLHVMHAEHGPRLPSLQLKVHVLSTAWPFLQVYPFTQYLTACSVLGRDVKMVRHVGDLPEELAVRVKEREGARVLGRVSWLPCRCDPEGVSPCAGSDGGGWARAVWRQPWPGFWALCR